LKARGWRVWGVEPVPRLADYASARHGIAVYRSLFEDCDFGGQTFDLIAMFHVLEHMASPSAAMARCRQMLRADGLLYLEVPDLFHPNRLRPEDFFQTAHLSTFSSATLARLLIKEGLEPVAIQRRGYFLRAVAHHGALPARADGRRDDWRDVLRIVESRRRWYPVVGVWRDALASGNARARRTGKRVILTALGSRIGRRAIAVLRRFS
jgi:SAM-dependent methyltransferase